MKQTFLISVLNRSTLLVLVLITGINSSVLAQPATVANPVSIGSPCGSSGTSKDSLKYFDYNATTNVLSHRYVCKPGLASGTFTDGLSTISFNPYDGNLYYNRIALSGGVYNTYSYRFAPSISSCPVAAPLFPTFINQFVAGVEFDPATGLGYQINFVDTSTGPAVIDPTANTGQYTSMAVVNGNPAVAYYDVTNGDLKYVRATNTNGDAIKWGTPVTVASLNNAGQYASLVVVNGNPAIAYFDATNSDLMYVRATDANGTAWGAPVTVASSGTVGQYASMAIVNGNPAISYYDATNGDLIYIRATNASGTAWGAPVTVESTNTVGQYTSLVIVNGNPAIAYYDATGATKDLRYARANDVNGATWGAPVLVVATNDAGQFASMAVINGNPAIAFYDNTNKDMMYVRANDVNGSAWGAAVTVASSGTIGQYASMTVVNGNPAISYYDGTNTNLVFSRANDANGSSWAASVNVETTGTIGQYTSMAIINGNPAVSYYDASNQITKYIRSYDANGTSWPVLSNVYNMQLQQVDFTTGTLGVSKPIDFQGHYIYAQNGDVVTTPNGQFLGVWDNKYFTLNWKDYSTANPLVATYIDTLAVGTGNNLVGLAYSDGRLVAAISPSSCATNQYNYIDILTGAMSPVNYGIGGTVFASKDMTNITSGIGVAKKLLSYTFVSSGTYDLVYEVKIQNFGTTSITNVQAYDSLININGAGNLLSSSISYFNAPAGITQNALYDGKTAGRFNLLTAGGTLSNRPGSNTITVRISCRVQNIIPGVVYYNSAAATANGIFGDALRDVSTNGSNPDLNNNSKPDDVGESTPTPLLVSVVAETPPCDSLTNILYTEDFGSGTGLTTTIAAPVVAAGVTSPVYASDYTGTTTQPVAYEKYTISNNANSGDNAHWINLADHTGNANGRMLLVNADNNSTVLFRGGFSYTLCANQQYSVSFYAAFPGNAAFQTLCNGFGGFVYPDLTIRVKDGVSGLIITQANTNAISSGAWARYGLKFVAPVSYSSIVFEIVNNASGGCGNDIALDDIQFGTCDPLPTVSLNHTNAGCLGTSASFTVNFQDPGALLGTPDYQWDISSDGVTWSPIAGATSATYTIASVGAGDVNKYYRARVASSGNLSNPYCSYTSPSYHLVAGCDIDDDDDGIPDTVESGGVDPLDDDDNDGIPNYRDTDYPGFVDVNADGINDNFDWDKDGIINELDLDSDNDGIPDVVEAGGVDANGDGKIDNYTDTDNDGLSQNVDANNTGISGSGSGLGLPDTDGDGIPNYLDLDSDNDGIPDVVETYGTDSNNDGIIDGYTDTDADGFSDNVDGDVGNDGTAENAANTLLRTGADINNDGRADSYPYKNMDADSKANPYDLDSDGDGITDVREAGFTDANTDGRADGAVNSKGWNSSIAALGSLNLPNTDGTGRANPYDIDSDDDGIPDNIEGQATMSYLLPTGVDTDGDGIDNAYDAFSGFGGAGINPNDQEGDTIPDYMDTDTDNDGVLDRIEGNDFNFNNVQDDNVTLTGTDTDGDGLDDRFDLINGSAKGTSGYMGNAGSFTGDATPGSRTVVQRTLVSYSDRDWRTTAYLLACQYLEFNGEKDGYTVNLNWSVKCDQPIDHFEVERSINGADFVKTGQVMAVSGQTAKDYSLGDDISKVGNYGNLYYRIKSVYAGGKYGYSSTVTIRLSAQSELSMVVTPNPVKSDLKLVINSPRSANARISIVDYNGKTLYKKTERINEGSSSITISETSPLPTGSYILYMEIDGEVQIKKFNKLN